MTRADLIWNRALETQGSALATGDKALYALLHVHNLVMNGGVFHAVEVLDENELADAQNGYKYFDLIAVAELIRFGRKLYLEDQDSEEWEIKLDEEYANLIPDDSALFQKFEVRLASDPADFTPLK